LRLHRRWHERWWRRHRENQGVRELGERPQLRPPLLLLADEDGDGELLLLGELGRHLEDLAAVDGLKIVVDDMIHVVYVVTDHPAVVYLAGYLAGDTRRWWSLGVVVILILVVLVLYNVVVLGHVVIVLILDVVVLVVGGHNGLPAALPVDIAEVAGAPVSTHFPPGEHVPVGGLDGEGKVAAHVHGKEGPPPVYLPSAL
jgi:hypothetical protein